MGELMTEHVTVTRINKDLELTDAKLRALSERLKKINLSDRTRWSNQTLHFAREMENMIILARVITLGALQRNESRVAHYKPEFPTPNAPTWLQTTPATRLNTEHQLTSDPLAPPQIPPPPPLC